MIYRILCDTNILISASLLAASKEFGVNIEHRFSAMSIRLLNFIKKNNELKLGIITYFIENEAYNALTGAVDSQLREEKLDIVTGSKVFTEILNICEDRLGEFIELLCKEKVDETEVFEIREEVDNMYDDLIKIAAVLPRNAASQANFVPKRFRSTAYRAYKQQDIRRNGQLLRLIGRRPGRNAVEDSDRIILSHATYLLRYYLRTVGAPFRMFLASCDFHFSPVRSGTIISDQVTSHIDHYLGIECDFPDKIYEIVQRITSEN